jgi:hypothetical protein
MRQNASKKSLFCVLNQKHGNHTQLCTEFLGFIDGNSGAKAYKQLKCAPVKLLIYSGHQNILFLDVFSPTIVEIKSP